MELMPVIHTCPTFLVQFCAHSRRVPQNYLKCFPTCWVLLGICTGLLAAPLSSYPAIALPAATISCTFSPYELHYPWYLDISPVTRWRLRGMVGADSGANDPRPSILCALVLAHQQLAGNLSARCEAGVAWLLPAGMIKGWWQPCARLLHKKWCGPKGRYRH